MLRAAACCVLCWSMLGCESAELSDLSSKEYGLISSVEGGSVNAYVQYRPLYLLYFIQNGQLREELTRQDVVLEMGNYLNFNLTIQGKAHSVEWKSLDLQKSMKLKYGLKEFNCAFVQQEAMGDTKKYLLSFNAPVEYGTAFSEDIELMIERPDSNWHFVFSKEHLNDAERLFEHFKK